jgi:hypothetical protein
VLLRQELDEIYAAFCETLPQELRIAAQQLPHRLKMAWAPSIPWSQVFGQEVTFAAPAFFAEAMPHISPGVVRDAVLAHTLAVIDAFGTDRVEDRQIEASAEVEEILRRVRNASDRALVRVVGSLSDDQTDFAVAQRAMLNGIRAERTIMVEQRPVDFELYESIALAKAGVGTPASIALARAAGWSAAECRAVARTLDSVWLGLQYHDDVIDWEDDLKRKSSWAVRLVMGDELDRTASDPIAEQKQVREAVLDSGILARLLERSARHFRAVRKRAEALGVRELAGWALKKEEHAQQLTEQERRSSGYAVRLHALSPWASHVLS